MISSPLSDVYVPDNVSLSTYVLDEAKKNGEKVAVTDVDQNQQITYNELIRQVHSVGSALWRRGLRKGDVVMMYSPNSIQYIIMFHAVVGQGGIISTCNPLFLPEELQGQIADSQAAILFTEKLFLPNVLEIQRLCPSIKAVITLDKSPGAWHYSDLLRDDGSAFPDVDIDPRIDIAVLPYSSGTTGKPKGVMLTHYNLVFQLAQVCHPGVRINQPGSCFVFAMPFYHIYGIIICCLAALRQGSYCILMRHFTLEKFLETAQNYKCDFLYTVPPILLLLAKDPTVLQYDLSSVRYIFCGAAPLSPELSKVVRKRFPKVKSFDNGFGMTELSPVATVTLPGSSDHGSIGVPVSNTMIKVIDPESGKMLGPNQDGELVVKGPQIMKGYLGNEKATKEMITEDGWLHTGDIGRYTEKGIFYITDRLKELIKYKGYQVAPADLEDLIHKMPDVADVAVVGIPDQYAGELPKAFVVRRPGSTLTSDNIINHVHDHVAPQKRLHGGVKFVDSIPKSPSGKILRRLLRDQEMKLSHIKAKL